MLALLRPARPTIYRRQVQLTATGDIRRGEELLEGRTPHPRSGHPGRREAEKRYGLRLLIKWTGLDQEIQLTLLSDSVFLAYKHMSALSAATSSCALANVIVMYRRNI